MPAWQNYGQGHGRSWQNYGQGQGNSGSYFNWGQGQGRGSYAAGWQQPRSSYWDNWKLDEEGALSEASSVTRSRDRIKVNRFELRSLNGVKGKKISEVRKDLNLQIQEDYAKVKTALPPDEHIPKFKVRLRTLESRIQQASDTIEAAGARKEACEEDHKRVSAQLLDLRA